MRGGQTARTAHHARGTAADLVIQPVLNDMSPLKKSGEMLAMSVLRENKRFVLIIVMVGVEGGVFGVGGGGLASSPLLEEQALKSSAEGEAWRALCDEGEALAKVRRTVDAAVAYNAACIVQVSHCVLCLCFCICFCVCVNMCLLTFTYLIRLEKRV